MSFFTIDNERLVISEGGNFDFKAGSLTTTGNLFLGGGNITTSGQINLTGTSTNIITATNVNGDLRLGAGGGTNDLKIDKNGNVDIFEKLTVAKVATLGDASLLATSAAPTTDAMIANKKYVDDLTNSSLLDDSMADTLHRHSELSASDGTPDPALSVDAAGHVGIGTASPDANLELSDSISSDVSNHFLLKNTLSSAGARPGFAWENSVGTFPARLTSESGSGHNAAKFLIQVSNSSRVLQDRLVIDVSGNVGIGTTTPTAKLHVDQASTTAAIPVLTLDQADISEEMIEFATTIGTGNAIEAVAAKTLTTTHFIKVTLPGGLTRYIPAGTIA